MANLVPLRVDFRTLMTTPLGLFNNYCTEGRSGSGYGCVPEHVILWQGFKQDVQTFFDGADKRNGIALYDNLALRAPIDGYEFGEEVSSIQGALQHGVFVSVRQVFEQTQDKVAFIQSSLDPRAPERQRSMIGNPDFMVYRLRENGKRTAVLAIEVKKPLPAGRVEAPLLQSYDSNNTRVRKMVHQITGYLSRNRLRYGILTTYENTYAVKYDDDNATILISDPFKHTDTYPSVIMMIWYLLLQAFRSKAVKKQLPQAKEHVTPRKRQREGSTSSNSQPNYPHQSWPAPVRRQKVDLHGIISKGESGSSKRVYWGKMNGVSIVVKCAAINSLAWSYLHHELRIFENLKHLQGDVIPRVLHRETASGKLYVVFEDVGIPIQNHERQKSYIRKSAFTALHKIHENGYVHGDISPRNIIINNALKRVFFIDLEFATLQSSSARLLEAKQLRAWFDDA